MILFGDHFAEEDIAEWGQLSQTSGERLLNYYQRYADKVKQHSHITRMIKEC